MKIGHIELFVSDPLASKDFFVNVLGFELVDNQEDQFIWLRLGEQEILLRKRASETTAAPFHQAHSNIVFYTEDLSATRTQLEQRGLKFEGEDQGCPIFKDLDGHWFQLVDPGGQ